MIFGTSKRQLLRMLERERIAHANERRELIATITELAGNPQASPIPRPTPAPRDENEEQKRTYGSLEEL